MKHDEHIGDDGSVRKNHYGVGRQPFDDIVLFGWGPSFAAGNVLKYLRRDKSLEHSLSSAKWYWQQIIDRSEGYDWWCCAQQLRIVLTQDEMARLTKGVGL